MLKVVIRAAVGGTVALLSLYTAHYIAAAAGGGNTAPAVIFLICLAVYAVLAWRVTNALGKRRELARLAAQEARHASQGVRYYADEYVDD